MTVTAARLGCERGTLSRLLNGKAGVSANMALALEDIGWGTADHWMRMQASYELAQPRRDRAAAERRAHCMHDSFSQRAVCSAHTTIVYSGHAFSAVG